MAAISAQPESKRSSKAHVVSSRIVVIMLALWVKNSSNTRNDKSLYLGNLPFLVDALVLVVGFRKDVQLEWLPEVFSVLAA